MIVNFLKFELRGLMDPEFILNSQGEFNIWVLYL
jgi:hypothetical protein